MKLYDYYRSSAAYRVRIALNLKGVPYTSFEVHMLNDGGQHLKPLIKRSILNDACRRCNWTMAPYLIQSLAILEWIEETYRDPPLLPRDLVQRARVRAVTNIVVSDIHRSTIRVCRSGCVSSSLLTMRRSTPGMPIGLRRASRRSRL